MSWAVGGAGDEGGGRIALAAKGRGATRGAGTSAERQRFGVQVQRWLKANQIKTIYIEPGSPWQNGFVESFQGRFRDECLNREQLWTLTEARVVVGDYRQKYNQVRPHSRLGYESPAMFAARNCPSPAPVGLRPPSAGDGQRTNENINSTMSQD